ESNLVKRHRPRFNVVLRDDKQYPYLRLPIKENFPRLSIVRRVQKDGALYYGPYTPAGALRETLKVIRKVFPLATCEIEIDGTAVRLQWLFVRGGLLIGRKDFFWPKAADASDEELVRSAIEQFYNKEGLPPKELLVPTPLSEAGLLEAWLSEKKGETVRIIAP